MKITFLGTGTSQGMPVIGCDCDVCRSPDPLNKRFRSSIFVETPEIHFVVDTTPDFRMQSLRANLCRLDAILYTHQHSDHILGLDELRRFCIIHQKRLPVYASRKVMEYISRMFPYALEKPPSMKGLPELDLHEITGPFSLRDLKVTPYRLPHGNIETLGFRFDDTHGPRFAYLTDCKEVPPLVRNEIRELPLVILDSLRKTPHPTHMSLSDTLRVVEDIKPRQALFTHIAHEMDHNLTNAELPAGVALAYDGQIVEI